MQVSERIHALKIPFEIRIGPETTVERFVYIYLIYGNKIHLIDTGVASSELKIFDYIKETGREPHEVSTVIQTHSHPDHIGATTAIKEATGCTVAVHEAERSWIEDVELQFRDRPVPGFHSLVGGSVEVDLTLQDENIQLEDDLTLKVYHTPGHSKGSVSILLREDNALFCGDAVPLKGDIPIYEDIQATISSINKLKSLNINFLLASWDQPRKNEEAYRIMDESLKYLGTVHRTVIQLSRKESSFDERELTTKVLEELGFPPKVANPLVVRSFQSSLKNQNMNLVEDR